MSSVAVAPFTTIDGPVPQAPRHHLFTVAESVERRWRGGVGVWAFPPDLPSGDDPCASGTFDTKDGGAEYENPNFSAFTAYLPVVCSAFINDFAELRRRADIVLDATDHHAAEEQLVAGAYADGAFLGDVNAEILGSGTAQIPWAAISYLDNAIGETGREGVIHIDPATADSFWGAYEVPNGEVLRTVRGTPVIVGTGYIGVRPLGGAAPGDGESWAFASGPVFAARGGLVRLSEDPAAVLDRDDNTVVYRAERDILVGWDGQLQAAVLVDWNP